MKIIITGAAGFIGFHLSKALCEKGYTVIGVDNLNDYYDVSLKTDRLDILFKYKNFTFKKVDISVYDDILSVFECNPDYVINLAAQAGVRYSIENPFAYVQSNLVGFVNILECCRNTKSVRHLIYASSSSVYGNNNKTPFEESDITDSPVSLYAATKKSNELIASTYNHLYNIPTTGLRFFTVYGPWGRPDMSPMLFADAISSGKPINVFNNGDMIRDFTYIDDIVNGIISLIDILPNKNEVYNIGCSNPVHLGKFIELIEKELGIEAKKNMLPMQPGDVHITYADVNKLINKTGYTPSVKIEDGVREFIFWFKKYYNK